MGEFLAGESGAVSPPAGPWLESTRRIGNKGQAPAPGRATGETEQGTPGGMQRIQTERSGLSVAPAWEVK